MRPWIGLVIGVLLAWNIGHYLPTPPTPPELFQGLLLAPVGSVLTRKGMRL